MRKSFYYSILIFIFSIMIGFYYSVKWKENNMQLSKENTVNTIVQETNFSEEKIGFDAEFALKKYYKECGHCIIEYSEIPSELINMSREEIEDNYPEWGIEEFSKDKLVLSQNINSLCDEHYVIKSIDKNVDVYRQKQKDNMELYKETGIATEYLSKEDIEKLEKGIYVYGNEKLNSTLEDFE